MSATSAASISPNTSTGTTDAGGQGVRWIRLVMITNLGLVALQAVSAGLLLSGNGRALTIHSDAAIALEPGILVQAVSTIVLWRRGRLPGSMAGLSIALFAIVVLQAGLGYRRSFWLHVPIGVLIFGWLTHQVNSLNSLSRPRGTPAATRDS